MSNNYEHLVPWPGSGTILESFSPAHTLADTVQLYEPSSISKEHPAAAHYIRQWIRSALEDMQRPDREELEKRSERGLPAPLTLAHAEKAFLEAVDSFGNARNHAGHIIAACRSNIDLVLRRLQKPIPEDYWSTLQQAFSEEQQFHAWEGLEYLLTKFGLSGISPKHTALMFKIKHWHSLCDHERFLETLHSFQHAEGPDGNEMLECSVGMDRVFRALRDPITPEEWGLIGRGLSSIDLPSRQNMRFSQRQ